MLSNEEAFAMLDQFMNEPITEASQGNTCDNCNGYIVEDTVNGLYVCCECGYSSESVMVNIAYTGFQSSRTPYKRVLYFREKLELMTGKRLCSNVKYNNVLQTLKKSVNDFDDISGLRAIMKKHKMKRFYKHVYNLFFDIKGYRAVKISNQEHHDMIYKFTLLERKFKRRNVRSNMLSYNSLVYLFLKNVDNATYENIYLPHNFKMIHRIYDNLSNTIMIS